MIGSANIEQRLGARTILVFGATGFIGWNLVTALAHAGHRVLVALRSSQDAGRAPAGTGITPVALALGDTGSIEAIVRDHGVDTVIHLASALKPSSSEDAYMAERDAVMTPTARLACVLARLGVRLVYFSSGGAIYGPGDAPHAEDDTCAPISFYGQSKLETEAFLRFAMRTAGLRHVIVRPSNPYGSHQPLNGTQGLISVALGRTRSGEALQVWGDGSSVRDYIHIDDLVAATVGLIERDLDNVTLNVGSGVGHSLLEIVRAVEAVTGRPVPLDFRPARSSDVPHLVLDVSRLQALSLYRARSLETGIREYARQLWLTDD